MAWQQLSVTCRAHELAAVEELLNELGALSISLRDAGDEPIYEPLPGSTPLWRESIVTATFADEGDADDLALMLAARLPPALAQTVTRGNLPDQDWIQSYRQHFKPIQCAPRLWIVPTWIDPPDPSATIVRLDPGLAFGTGGHPTTALCLAWLAQQPLDDLDVVDFGCGSGILAIAAIKLGARRVVAVDIDAQALDACRSNMALNSIAAERIEPCLPRQAGTSPCDLLMANILASPLIELVDEFAEMVRPGGKILLSGILISQLNEIQSAYDEHFELHPARERDGWACISGERRRQEADG